MQTERPFPAVFQIAFQAKADTAESQLFPGNLVFVTKPGFQAFDSRGVMSIQEFAPIKEVDLTDAGNIHQGKQGAGSDPGTGFLFRFPGRCNRAAFTVLHEAGGQSPEAFLRSNGSPTKQNALVPFGNAAHDEFGILVFDMATGVTDRALHVVASRNLLSHGLAALGAVKNHGNTHIRVRRV